MLNPAKNARAIGFLLFIGSLLGIISLIGALNEYTPLAIFISTVTEIIVLVVAYGLIKNKVWSIYGIGAIAILKVLTILYNYTLNLEPTRGSLVALAIYIILFFWFYSGKKEFKK